MGRPREHDYEQVRPRVVEAAGQLLARSGPNAVTMRGLADECDVSTNLLYRLFEDKADVVEAMFVAGFERLHDRLEAVPTDLEPTEELLRLGRAYRHAALDSPHLYEVMFARPIPEFEPSDELVAWSRRSFRRVIDAAERLMEQRSIDDDPWRVAMVLHGLVHGLASIELKGWFGDDADRIWDRALRMVAAAIAQDGLRGEAP